MNVFVLNIYRTISITSRTSIFKSSKSIDIDDDKVEAATALLSERTVEASIQDALASPKKAIMNVKGVVAQVCYIMFYK